MCSNIFSHDITWLLLPSWILLLRIKHAVDFSWVTRMSCQLNEGHLVGHYHSANCWAPHLVLRFMVCSGIWELSDCLGNHDLKGDSWWALKDHLASVNYRIYLHFVFERDCLSSSRSSTISERNTGAILFRFTYI